MEYEEILEYVREIYSNESGFSHSSCFNCNLNVNIAELRVVEISSTASLLVKIFKANNLLKISDFIRKIRENIDKIAITYSFDNYVQSEMLKKFMVQLKDVYELKMKKFTEQKNKYGPLLLISKRFYNDMLDILNGNNLTENNHIGSILEDQPSHIRFKIETEIISDLELLSHNLPRIQRKKLKLEK